MPSRIFISYRRDDASHAALNLHHRLTTEFGEEHVFWDIDSIEPGENFVRRIDSFIASCQQRREFLGQTG